MAIRSLLQTLPKNSEELTKNQKGQLAAALLELERLQKELIIVNGSIPTQGDMEEKEFIVRVDYQTKLPISLEMLKCGSSQGVKSIERIEYNVAIPEGIFDFEIPKNAEVVNISDIEK